MAPRKKPTSKSNQNQPNSQPSKFGIQHFFLRHSQSSSSRPNDSVSTSDPNSSSKSAPPLQNPTTAPDLGIAGESSAVLAVGNPGKALNSEHNDPKNGISTLQKPKSSGRTEAVSNFGYAFNSGTVDSNSAVSTRQNPRSAVPSASTSNSRKTDPNNSSQNTPPDNIPAMAMDVEKHSQVSPEVSKSTTLKRFKFSPGMVTKS